MHPLQGTRKLKAHGIGVHTPEEIEEFGKSDLRVLSDMLGDKPYFFGDEPTEVRDLKCSKIMVSTDS